MRILSATLLAAQQAASLTPAVKIEVKNKMTGVTRLNWERLYQGSEDEYYHGMTAADDGSLIRTRITLPADGRKLYRQRTVNQVPSLISVPGHMPTNIIVWQWQQLLTAAKFLFSG